MSPINVTEIASSLPEAWRSRVLGQVGTAAVNELNRTCSADIPERGEFHTYEGYRICRLRPPAYDPHGVILALDEGAWIGMAATSRPGGGEAWSEMTGVLRSHRGRGTSMAMKLLAIDYARTAGARWVRTIHHPANTSVITLNRRLGFIEA